MDEEFRQERLAAIYDALDSDRRDLNPYVEMIEGFGAHRVLDVGCGTGTLAIMLAQRGHEVIGLDPAIASLEVARAKPDGDRVRWIEGDATALPLIECDAVTMTANVSQFITDPSQWQASLRGIRNVLAPSGHLIFETRNPAARGWDHWTRDQTFERVTLPTGESVERCCEVKTVSWPLIQFVWTFKFESDDATSTSTSTLRFRERDEVEAELLGAGFQVVEVRDAPDRPGREFVFVARRAA